MCVAIACGEAVCTGAPWAFKGRFHARCESLENGRFVHLLVLSSGGRHGPRIDRTHRVPQRKLELSASTTDVRRTPMGAETCRTQEELPAEPESGSEGSSTVESTSVTRKRSDAGLLCISLMHDLNNVLGRAAKTGRRPVITIRGAPGRSPSNGCLAGTGGMPSSHPPNGDHGTRVCHEDSRLRAPFGCRRRQGCRR